MCFGGLLSIGFNLASSYCVAESVPLKSIVQNAQKQLKSQEPWQERLFFEEVMPQFQRFIQGTTADLEGIRHYLAFFGPSALKQKEPKILVLLKTDSGCLKCLKSKSEIQSLVRLRLERRGLVPVWANPEDFDLEAGRSVLETQLLEKSKKLGACGALGVFWSPTPAEDLDTAHADEELYQIYSFLKVGEFSKQTRKKDLFNADSFATLETNILNDFFAELGEKLDSQDSGSPKADLQEIQIDFSGIKNFSQYLTLKKYVQSTLKEMTSVDERIFSKGRVVFAVYPKGDRDEFVKKLTSMIDDEAKRQGLSLGIH